VAERWSRRDALHQGIAVAAIVVLAVAGMVYLRERPQGPASLKAEVSTLRSQAAETELVLSSASQLDARFMKAHAEQLAKNIERAQDSIGNLNVQPALRDAQRFARNEAQRLHGVAQAASQGDVTSQRTLPRIIAGELQVLEHTLER